MLDVSTNVDYLFDRDPKEAVDSIQALRDFDFTSGSGLDDVSILGLSVNRKNASLNRVALCDVISMVTSIHDIGSGSGDENNFKNTPILKIGIRDDQSIFSQASISKVRSISNIISGVLFRDYDKILNVVYNSVDSNNDKVVFLISGENRVNGLFDIEKNLIDFLVANNEKEMFADSFKNARCFCDLNCDDAKLFIELMNKTVNALVGYAFDILGGDKLKLLFNDREYAESIAVDGILRSLVINNKAARVIGSAGSIPPTLVLLVNNGCYESERIISRLDLNGFNISNRFESLLFSSASKLIKSGRDALLSIDYDYAKSESLISNIIEKTNSIGGRVLIVSVDSVYDSSVFRMSSAEYFYLDSDCEYGYQEQLDQLIIFAKGSAYTFY